MSAEEFTSCEVCLCNGCEGGFFCAVCHRERISALESENAKLLYALKKYGDHLHGTRGFCHYPHRDCDCGYDAALASEPKKEKGE